ncbi:hypothetical protein P692DRAFT_20834033, partial [Suillus brevipes Sb2]
MFQHIKASRIPAIASDTISLTGFSSVLGVVFLLLHRCSMTIGTDARVTRNCL